ncbi:CotS family spore coat protein [Bacillus carboniphilus]|uniref:CotS family spore coat protein n=1 Tax=Bacillus carboniphilus TaxID=86663 RepID=A0ABY9JUC3_9BACI|nr:CotS family spore coat protein [Bacillus carboniphilus]WLR42994.1 CotS family spore coat protein [Bacillus carboniphilus]
MKNERGENMKLDKVLDLYPLEIDKVELLSNRSGRTIWEVETEDGNKVLKQAFMNPRRMVFITGAHHHLYNQGLPITKIQPTKKGGLCIGSGDSAFVLYDKVMGKEMSYYNQEHLKKMMEFAGRFHHASKGYKEREESKKRSRLGKWEKLYRWKIQELEGHKLIAQSYTDDQFSQYFLEHVDEMISRGKRALKNLIEQSYYDQWTKQTLQSRSFCQQDFTLARIVLVEDEPFMRELHSVSYDLPSRDLRIILNKVMKKMSIWDEKLALHILASYDAIHPLNKDQYRVLWTDLLFPHLFCATIHKYYLQQKSAWSDEKYMWMLQNIIQVENSKASFLNQFDSHFNHIKEQSKERSFT